MVSGFRACVVLWFWFLTLYGCLDCYKVEFLRELVFRKFRFTYGGLFVRGFGGFDFVASCLFWV